VLSWIVSVKGSEEIAFKVPYLQTRSWQRDNDIEYVVPIVVITLLDALPQPFDKAAAVYCIAFKRAEQLKFAGLQSNVPGVAEMQSSISSSLDRAADLQRRVTDSFPYQGGVDDVYSIMGRFSSRDPSVVGNEFPFPIKITSWPDSYNKDNFDYLANLYKFYTGDTQLKVLFSRAPADGVIQATIGNTRVDPLGSDFKAGNGIVISHQAVWPMLEMVFPYMCIDEFNSVFDVEPMYIQEISAGATIAQYLIAMTDNFRVFYLMPVPDFFLTEESAAEPLGPENEEVAEFQSVSRLAGTYCVADKRSILLGDESTTVTIIDDPAFNGKLINGKIWVSLEFDSDL